MPSGNAVVADKMKLPAAGGGAGGQIRQPHFRPWFPDERDSFISWLRGEFAAANAIIDALCHHERAIGEPGEYDSVSGCVQQRRYNWNPVLHMQQYFSIAEVVYSLQQVGWRRRQPPPPHRQFDRSKVAGKDARRSHSQSVKESRLGQKVESVEETHVLGHPSHADRSSEGLEPANGKCEEPKFGADIGLSDNKSGVVISEGDGVNKVAKLHSSLCVKNVEPAEETVHGDSDVDRNENEGLASNSKGSCNVMIENTSHSNQNQNGKQNVFPSPKTFVGTEIFDGKAVNVVDGLKLYENLCDNLEVSKLVSLVNELRDAGKRGQLQGHTFVVSKRPIKGHGREMIQLGPPIADAPFEDENASGTSKDPRIEPIPALLQDVIEQLGGMHVMNFKPDSCIIDFFNEGDHSHAHMWPQWFRRPVCLLTLTECDLTYGRVIVSDYPGAFRGPLKLSLSPGSLLVMEGKSADFARHAIPSLRKQRILVTFAKSQPKKAVSIDRQVPSSAVPPSHWGQPPSRSPNHNRHLVGAKQYVPVSTTGALLGPAIRPQLPPTHGIQPLIVSVPVNPAIPFPAPVSLPAGTNGWQTSPSRHPPPCLPVPGTGVFLPPPGSSNASPPHQLASAAEMNFSTETAASHVSTENGSGNSNSESGASTKGLSDGNRQGCNGNVDVTVGTAVG